MPLKLSLVTGATCVLTWGVGAGLASYSWALQVLGLAAVGAAGVLGINLLLRPLKQLSERARQIADNPVPPGETPVPSPWTIMRGKSST